MTRARGWLQMLWPAALLIVVLATFRPSRADIPVTQPAHECDEVRARTLSALQDCLELDSRNVEVLTALGDIHARSGVADRAEEMYRRALAIDPDDGDVRVRLGALLLERGRVGEAHREAERALASEPGNPAVEQLVERASQESHR
jgi:predicted Zn-dependent protease